MVWYGEEYGKELGLRPLLPETAKLSKGEVFNCHSSHLTIVSFFYLLPERMKGIRLYFPALF